MAIITDVSPTRANTALGSGWPFTTGRMLSLASSDDGRFVVAGSFASGVWLSQDGGETFAQAAWPQPAAGQFGVPGALGGYCVTSLAVGPDASRWRGERNPRVLADVTGDGRADIVGFGDTGVWVARGQGDGTFAPPSVVLANFGAAAGGWRADAHPRLLGPLTASRRADIVGFGDDGVWTALARRDGTFEEARFVLADFGYHAGWRVDAHLRVLADLRGHGRLDIVAFGDAGVYVALGNGDGTFAHRPQPVLADFGRDQGWETARHPRFVADLTGNGCADIVGFGDAGVYVALGNGDGTFQPARFVLAAMGYNAGWRADRHPRCVADLRGRKRMDLVGFGDDGVHVAISNGDGTFAYQPAPAIADFGYVAGGWRSDRHLRFVADVNGDGRADIVGFGEAGVYVARGNGDGTFAYPPQAVVADFGYAAGAWRVADNPRVLADLTGSGRADIVAFGDAGVYVALANRDGTFAAPRYVHPHFGPGPTVLALLQCDREREDAGLWRSPDGGRTWTRVHAFPRAAGSARLPGAGQVVWAPGNASHVYAAGGSSLAVSTDGGATFVDVMPMPTGGFQTVYHVAAAETPAGALVPPVVYALASSRMYVSLDGGATWRADQAQVPADVGGPVGTANSQNERVLVVSPRSPLEVFVAANANVAQPVVSRGDYSQFAATQTSTWPEPLPAPNLGGQFSGNAFIAAPRPGHGDIVFYGPQRAKTFVAPLDPASAADWHELDAGQHVHVDLHGIFLSPDFAATFAGGQYRHLAGTVWMASDGGIFRSTDGGDTFHSATGINTLSCVNVAGTALPGTGPVISLNSGDNDGFTSGDGGATWRPQNYGGGDNDCTFADPLRPHSMLVFTPRWDEHGGSPGAALGQTVTLYEAAPGALPDLATAAMRRIVPGPMLRPKSTIWNASSGFGLRGYRPLVPNLATDPPDAAGDYLFVRYYGNFNDSSIPLQRPNHLAVLLRTRQLPQITKRSHWDTPGRWRVERHPRLLGDLRGIGRADIVAFGEDGVWTALSNGNGTFADPRFVLADLGYQAGGWRVDRHVRVLADLRGNGRADIVAFGDAGVYVALSNADGSFTYQPQAVVPDFGFDQGWRVDRHPRFVADVTGDGHADIVGFGDAGVWVALGNGDGTFQPPRFVLADLGYDHGWRVDRHPRVLADLRNRKRMDIVAFGDAGVYAALANGDGTFAFTLAPAVTDFGYAAGGWRVDRHPRFAVDVTGDGCADIVGFGDAGVYVALGNGDGTFQPPQFVLADLGYDHGWRVDEHPRMPADLRAQGRADLVGFGNDGVYVALANGDGTFAFTPQPALNDFGLVAGGWHVERHPRFAADVTGDRCADIVGFGDAGVLVAKSNGDGTLQPLPLFVIPNFGYGDDGFATQVGPFLPEPNIGIVQGSGGHDATVFYVGGDSRQRLWKWTAGMPAWQQIVPGRGAAAARRFFVNPYLPDTVYVLDATHVLRSDDGGAQWQVDASLEQQLTGGGRIPIGRNEDDDGMGDHLDVVLADMAFDPHNPRRRFAVGLGGAFMTRDGVNWERLLDTNALCGRPANCFFDAISQPRDPALYVSFAGRSIVRIGGL